jgi:hypothetical protein
MKLKIKHFHIYNLVTVCFDYASKILRTRYREPVQYTYKMYWVTWFVESGVHRTAIKLQKNETGNCSIWNKFYSKYVYLNKYNIKIVNMSCDYVAWYFVNSLGIKNGKQLMKQNTRIIANWVLKLKIKMSRCNHVA